MTIIIDAIKDTKIAQNLEVLDLDTGEFLRGVKWANQETGEYESYVFDKDGEIQINFLGYDTTTKKGNIVFVYKGE